ncbi:MAG: hypothetical protein RI906_3165, partial [Pseudomonadota bacterium]
MSTKGTENSKRAQSRKSNKLDPQLVQGELALDPQVAGNPAGPRQPVAAAKPATRRKREDEDETLASATAEDSAQAIEAADSSTDDATGFSLVELAQAAQTATATDAAAATGAAAALTTPTAGVLIGAGLFTLFVANRSAKGSPVPTASGVALDGYLANALVWRDKNNNGQWDTGEDYAFTDANGAFSGLTGDTGVILRAAPLTDALRAALTGEPAGKSLDIATGDEFWGVLSAPGAAKVISPLTTMLVAVNNDAVKVAAIKAALKIPSSVDLTNFDPLAVLSFGNPSAADVQTAITVQKASLQVANIMIVAIEAVQALNPSASVVKIIDSVAASLASASALNETSIAAALGKAAQAGDVALDAAAITAISRALNQANVELDGRVSAAVTTPQEALRELTEGVGIQIVVIDDLALMAAKVAAVPSLALENPAAPYTGDSMSEKLAIALEAVGSVLARSSSRLMAADDYEMLFGGSGNWKAASGNALSNDLSTTAFGLRLSSAKQGEASSSASTQTVTAEGITLKGTYGSLSLKENGDYVYTVTDANALKDKLAKDTFTYTVSGAGGTATGSIVVNLDGRNAAPIVEVVNASAQEAGYQVAAADPAKIDLLGAATDRDGDTLSVVGLTLQGKYGTLTLNPDKSYKYTLDQTNAAVNKLDSGQRLTETFEFGISDGYIPSGQTQARSTKSVLVITINGTNDAPTLATPLSNQTAEESQSSLFTYTVGAGAFTDPEGHSLSYSVSATRDGKAFALDGSTWLKVNTSNLSFSGKVGDSDAGSYVITISATDSKGAVSSQAFTLTVAATDTITATDGYLADALVWRDINGNFVWDSNEPSTRTNAFGLAPPLAGSGTVRVAGWDFDGTLTKDISTGTVFAGVLSSPSGTNLVTPLTTLLATASDPVAAQGSLLKALGITSPINLLTFDPLASAAAGKNLATALEVQKVSIQVANLLRIVADATDAVAGTDPSANLLISKAVNAVAANLMQSAQTRSVANQALPLDNVAVIKSALGAITNAFDGTSDIRTKLTSLFTGESLQLVADSVTQVNARIESIIDDAISKGVGDAASAAAQLTKAIAAQIVLQEFLSPAIQAAVAVGASGAVTTGAFSYFTNNFDKLAIVAVSKVGQLYSVKLTDDSIAALDDNDRVGSTIPRELREISGELIKDDVFPEGINEASKAVIGARVGNEASLGSFTPITTSTALNGTYGTLTLNRNGSYTYKSNQTLDQVNAYVTQNSGKYPTDIFTYKVAATKGSATLEDTATLTITVDGLNFVANSQLVGAAVVENSQQGGQVEGSVSGNLLADTKDFDGDQLFVTSINKGDVADAPTGSGFLEGNDSVTGKYGTLTVNRSTGDYTYVLSADRVDVLAAGVSEKDYFFYGVTDDKNSVRPANEKRTVVSQLVITITGQNDTARMLVDRDRDGDFDGTDGTGSISVPEHSNSLVVTKF